ncbi:MAG: phosphate signaling complex protein PhoU [Deferribacterota bacterium]|nr:phosphate signaling complex protein PhoU [Deferribacterota bacterium]
MKIYFEEEYVKIKSYLAKMTNITTEMLENAITALVNIDSDLAKNTIKLDNKVDYLENKIDSICIKVLALYEPKAIDLRFVITTLRIIVDIERIADHCVGIARETLNLIKYPPLKPYIDLPLMGEQAGYMLKEAIDAFFSYDDENAINIIKQDKKIDDLYVQVVRELLTYVTNDATTISQILSLMFIGKSLERIGDYTKNVCEQVYFMSTGKMIRHRLKSRKDNE